MKKSLLVKVAVPILLTGVIALIGPPEGLEPAGWYYFAIFAGVIAALILEPIPAAAVGVIGVTVVALLGLAASHGKPSAAWALGGFSNTTVWLIFGAFMLALGYKKTELGKRISLILVKLLGKRTLTLGYAVTAADLMIAPFVPSNTARSAGTIYPLISNIPPLYESTPESGRRRIGSYLMWTALAATCITSSMFLTALAPNLLAKEIVSKNAGIDITWGDWFIGFLPAGILLLALVPLVIYLIYPPEVKKSEKVPRWAADELKKMGKVKWQEIVMALLVLGALALWIFGGSFLHSSMVAVVVICLMLVSGILKWSDITEYKSAWNVFVWFATLVTLAGGLKSTGFVDWFASWSSSMIDSLSVTMMMIALVVIFFVIHYMFASVTAHTAAVLPVILAAGIAVEGINAPVFALLLVFSLGIMGIITPYATGPGPVYYGSGFISRGEFWKMGSIFGALFLAVLLAVVLPWLMLAVSQGWILS
ncbi:MAG: anion permease [Planctomycetota bacterium]|nr:anion permease [Planctomycetota bacterium]